MQNTKYNIKLKIEDPNYSKIILWCLILYGVGLNIGVHAKIEL